MRRILIIYTGGTIGMVNDAGGVLRPFDFSQITANVPELARLDYRLESISFDPVIDSSDMDPQVWLKLARLIADQYEDFDGFVVLHGSDTMAFTASALSFLFKNLGKPVVLTGSQLPIGEIRTDAKENLITALEIASAKKDGKAMVPEVCIYFDYRLFRGNRSIKYDSSKFEAFQSPNYPALAEAGVHLEFYNNYIASAPEGNFSCFEKLDPEIGILKLYPGIPPQVVDAILSAPGRAVIMETFGAGNSSTKSWFLDRLKQAIDEGKIILDISQCKSGMVELGRYQTSSSLKEIGVLSGRDMTFEAAVTKLMYLLALHQDRQAIVADLERNLRGELSEN